MDSRLCKKVYKIRQRATGLFSTGGKMSRWVVSGKIWTKKDHLLLYLKQFSKYELTKMFKNCEIVCYEMEEVDIIEMTKLR